MHMTGSPVSPETGESDRDNVVLRCERYREAFLLLLNAPFEDLDDSLMRMLAVLATTLDVDRVGLWLFTDAPRGIQCAHQWDREVGGPVVPDVFLAKDYPHYFSAISSELLITVTDTRTDARTSELSQDYLEPLGILSLLDVPVRAFGRYLGVLCHEHRGTTRLWTAEEQHFASGVANQIALAHERHQASKAQRALLWRCTHDEQTQLPNRAYLDGALHTAVSESTSGVTLIVTSVDQCSYLLGALDNRTMATVAQQIAEHLLRVAPGDWLVARTAPNEFALLIQDKDPAALAHALHTLADALKLTVQVGRQRVPLTWSSGYSQREVLEPDDVNALISEAQLASVAAHTSGGNCLVQFDSVMRSRLAEQLELEQEMRDGLEAAEFKLFFQPVFKLECGTCVAVEALLRWQHPERGVIFPDAFLPVALSSGLILDLSRFVVREACQSISKLRQGSGLTDLQIAINMSAPEIVVPGTVELLADELTRANVTPESLTLEITESALILDLGRAADVLSSIRNSGIKVSLDDFGTAYSSLSWLRQLPIDNVKIDRGFVAGMIDDHRDRAIVEGIAALTRSFGREVIAEGIDTVEQLAALRAIGVEFGQGYLFSRAVPLEEFVPTLLHSCETLFSPAPGAPPG